MAVCGRHQLHVGGAVAAPQQPVTRCLQRLVVAEPRCVEHGGCQQDRQHGNTRASRPDVAASVQRVTDGDVATQSHVHCEPRAAQLERVDQTLQPAQYTLHFTI